MNNLGERVYMEERLDFKDHRQLLIQRISSHENSRLARRLQPSSRISSCQSECTERGFRVYDENFVVYERFN